MIKSAIFGDSVVNGSLANGKTVPLPIQILNQYQKTFDFAHDYSKPGANFAGFTSDDKTTRELNGLPNGITFDDYLKNNPDVIAYLIGLGGNDDCSTETARQSFTDRIDIIANTLKANGKLFAFLGIIDINIESQMINTGVIDPIVNYKPYMHHAVRIAACAETLRQWCNLRKYPYVDIRRMGNPVGFNNITGDIVHPQQEYCNYIFSSIGKMLQQ